MPWFRKQKSAEAFRLTDEQKGKNARYGNYFRSSSFVFSASAGEQEEYTEAAREQGNEWTVRKIRKRRALPGEQETGADNQAVISSDSGRTVSFFEALASVALYEVSQGGFHGEAKCRKIDQELGPRYFRAFAHYEDIIFDCAGAPHLAGNGTVPPGDFPEGEIAALEAARNSRLSLVTGMPLSLTFKKSAEADLPRLRNAIVLEGCLTYTRDALANASGTDWPPSFWHTDYVNRFYARMKKVVGALSTTEAQLPDEDMKSVLKPLRFGCQIALVMMLAQRNRDMRAENLYGDKIEKILLDIQHQGSGYESYIDWFRLEYDILYDWLDREEKENGSLAPLKKTLPDILRKRPISEVQQVLNDLKERVGMALKIITDSSRPLALSAAETPKKPPPPLPPPA